MKFYPIILLFLLSTIFGCDKSTSAEEVENIADTTKDEQTVTDTTPLHKLARLKTDFGNLLFWLHNQTPQHKNHFIALIEEGFFNQETINRVVKNFVVQGGCPDTSNTGFVHYPIEPEFDSSLQHIYGALGMGRYGEDVNPEKWSNGCQFYIVSDTSGEHQLDMNYTIFGQLVDGFQALDSLNRARTGLFDDVPRDSIIISWNMEEWSEKALKDSFNFEP